MRSNQSSRSNSGVARAGWYGLGLLTMLFSLGGKLSAGGPISVPEIDAGSISAGLGLLAGGILILRARRRSK